MKKNILILLLGLITFNSCMDYVESRELVVSNQSSNSIYSIISDNDDMGNSRYYLEFKANENNIYPKIDSLFEFRISEINSGDKAENHDTPRNWESYFDRIGDKKLRLFIVSKDSVTKYGWRTIFKKQVYIKKYKLGLEDLEKSKWEIVYQ
jgi:hypothetical protein